MNYENIKTWEDACKVTGDDPNKLPDVSTIRPKHQKYILAQLMLAIITEAINTDENGKVWEPNWNDHSEAKYFPWFGIEANEDNTAGVGFSGSDCDRWSTAANVGSRLCFDTPAKVRHIQKYFKELHLDQMLIRK